MPATATTVIATTTTRTARVCQRDVHLHQPGVLLVNATGEWLNRQRRGAGVQMDCVLQVDGAGHRVPQSFGEGGTTTSAAAGTMALTASAAS